MSLTDCLTIVQYMTRGSPLSMENNFKNQFEFVCVCACVRARACVRASVCVCVGVGVCVRVLIYIACVYVLV